MKNLLFILLFLFVVSAFAHKNVLVEKTYGNVHLISSTAYYTEDINKNIITAKYADLLLKELNFNETIHLRLADDGDLKIYANYNTKDPKNNGLYILIENKETEMAKILYLIENIISHMNQLDKKRNEFQNWYNKSENSKLVKKILSNKINRPNDVSEIQHTGFFDYYIENEVYHVLSYQNREVIEVAQMNDILQFSVPTPSLLFVFTEKKSLTIITANYKHDGTKFNATSESLTFEFKPKWEYSFQPFSIRLLGKKYITIESMFGDQISLYNISTKKIIDDLSTKIDE